jgi:hypothetical protein
MDVAKKSKVIVTTVKPAQQQLPGSEDERNPQLEAILTNYVSHRDTRMLHGAAEVSAKNEAIAFMKENKIDVYQHGAFDARITAGEESIKVRIAKVGQ